MNLNEEEKLEINKFNYEKLKNQAFDMMNFCKEAYVNLQKMNLINSDKITLKEILDKFANKIEILEEKKNTIKILFWGMTNSGKSSLISALINNKPIRKLKESYLPISANVETMYFHYVILTHNKMLQNIKFTFEKNGKIEDEKAFEDFTNAKDYIKNNYSRKVVIKKGQLIKDFIEEKKNNEEMYFKSEINNSNSPLLSYCDNYPLELIDTPGISEQFSLKLLQSYFQYDAVSTILVISFGEGTLHHDVIEIISKNLNDKKFLSNLIIVITKIEMNIKKLEDEEQIEAIENFESGIMNYFKDSKIKPKILHYNEDNLELQRINDIIRDKILKKKEKNILLNDFKPILVLLSEFNLELLKCSDVNNIKKHQNELKKSMNEEIELLREGFLLSVDNFFNKKNDSEFEKIINQIIHKTHSKLIKNNGDYKIPLTYRSHMIKELKILIEIEIEKEIKNKFEIFLKAITMKLHKKVENFQKENNILDENLKENLFMKLNHYDIRYVLSQIGCFIIGIGARNLLIIGIEGMLATTAMAISGGLAAAFFAITTYDYLHNWSYEEIHKSIVKEILINVGKINDNIQNTSNNIIFPKIQKCIADIIDDIFLGGKQNVEYISRELNVNFERFQMELKELREILSNFD